MATDSQTFTRTNAVLLVFVLPIVLRYWVEAVIWRLSGGPQMLGFSLVHGGAGWLTPVFIGSFIFMYVYFLWVVSVCVRWLIPVFRKRNSAHHVPLLAGAVVYLFFLVASQLQKNLSPAGLAIGAVALSALVLVIVGLIFHGLKSTERGSGAV